MLRKLMILFSLLMCTSVGAFAQFYTSPCTAWDLGLDPEDPLTPYYQEMCAQFHVSSPGMLPPPGGPSPNQQTPCPPDPPPPNPMCYADGITVLCYGQVIHGPGPDGCSWITWEPHVANPNDLAGRVRKIIPPLWTDSPYPVVLTAKK